MGAALGKTSADFVEQLMVFRVRGFCNHFLGEQRTDTLWVSLAESCLSGIGTHLTPSTEVVIIAQLP